MTQMSIAVAVDSTVAWRVEEDLGYPVKRLTNEQYKEIIKVASDKYKQLLGVKDENKKPQTNTVEPASTQDKKFVTKTNRPVSRR